MILSNRGGGSVLYYQLGEKEGYLGSYDNDEVYDDSLGVDLVNNYRYERFCSPCLTVNDNYVNQPFSLLTNVYNDSVYVSLDEELKLVYRHEFSDSDYLEKIIIISFNKYEQNRFWEMLYSSPAQHSISWGTITTINSEPIC